jgi:hypothetical protein
MIFQIDLLAATEESILCQDSPDRSNRQGG